MLRRLFLGILFEALEDLIRLPDTLTVSNMRYNPNIDGEISYASTLPDP